MANVTNGKRARPNFSIMWQLILLTLIPIVALTLIILMVSISSMKDGMEDEALEGLENTATMIAAAYDAQEGNFSVNDAGNLLKGETDVSIQAAGMANLVKDKDVDFTIIYGKTRMITTLDQSFVGKDISDEVYAEVSKGNTFVNESTKIGDDTYFVACVPLYNSDQTIAGSVFVGKKAENVESYIGSKRNTIIGIAMILLILVAVVAAMMAKSIAAIVQKSEGIIAKVSDGDMNVSIDQKLLQNQTELGLMARSIDDLSKRLREVIGHISNSTTQLTDAGNNLELMASQSSETADGISNAVEDISKGAVSQAEDIETATKEMYEMGQYFSDIVKGVERLDSTSDMMHAVGSEAVTSMEELSESNDKTANAISRISRQVHQTNISAEEIREAVNIIAAIATETNLLSLNASIEAARAGEAGKGFAVVASQIQKLADESNESAQKIEDVITNLLDESQMTVQVMSEVEETIAEQQKKMDATKTKFDQITRGISDTREETRNIDTCTKTCDQSREKMFDIIQNLSAISQENAASTQETTASMQELNATINLLAQSAKELKEMADSLQDEMAFFKL